MIGNSRLSLSGAINNAAQLAKIEELVEAGQAEGAEMYQPACELPARGYFVRLCIRQPLVELRAGGLLAGGAAYIMCLRLRTIKIGLRAADSMPHNGSLKSPPSLATLQPGCSSL
jgi:hypothetical protein